MSWQLLPPRTPRPTVAILCLVVLAACQANVTETEPDGSRGDHHEVLTHDGLHSMMVSGGCTMTDRPADGVIVSLRSPRGDALLYDCTVIGVDSMLSLASVYQRIAMPRQDHMASATATSGHYEWDGYWREYCYVSLPSYTPIQCGIWRYTEVPRWVPGESGAEPTDEDWDLVGGGSGGGDGGGGQGGGEDGDEEVEEIFCPEEDTTCWRVLEQWERDLIVLSVQRHVRPLWAITNPTAMSQCSTAVTWMNQALATLSSGTNSVIWAGTGDFEPSRIHDAETNATNTRFHIDPAILARARGSTPWEKELAALVMHEAAHLVSGGNRTHPNANAFITNFRATNPPGTPLPSPEIIYANDDFFKYIHSTDPSTACVSP